jgi:hypothetical protein
VLWVGTDDGNLQVSRDGGVTWTNVSGNVPGLPKDAAGRVPTWISRVEASRADAATAYASFDGHRDDDFRVYLYRTADFGRTWQSIGRTLPDGAPINVIREDPVNPSLLFAGTETGAWVSIDTGRNWARLSNGLPTVPVDDLVVHPRDGELVAGTHGRSIYILDIAPLQQLSDEALISDAHLFAPKPATLWRVDLTRNKGASGARRFAAPNPYSELVQEGDASGLAPPGAAIYYYLKTAARESVKIVVADASGRIVRELAGPAEAGLNRVLWDLRTAPLPLLPAWRRVGGNDSYRLAQSGPHTRPGPLVKPGEYRITLSVGGRELVRPLRVEADNGGSF